MSVQIFDLSHTFEPFMPQWPSGCNLKEEVIRFHAFDGMYNVQWEGIMHRGTHMDAPLHVTELTPDITQYPRALLRLRRLPGTSPRASGARSSPRICRSLTTSSRKATSS